MRRVSIVPIFVLLIAAVSFSCKETEDPEIPLPIIDGGKIIPLSLAKVHVPNLPERVFAFSGTFDNLPIDLGRKEGDSLLFIVPNVPIGAHELVVNVGGKIQQIDIVVEAGGELIPGTKFLDDFLSLERKLDYHVPYNSLLLKLIENKKAWLDHFKKTLATLNADQREDLSKLMQRTVNAKFFTHWKHEDDLLYYCSNFPEPELTKWTEKYYFIDGQYFSDIVGLPKNKFHDAVFAAYANAIYFQHLLSEFIAIQIAGCPMLRRIEFTKPGTSEPIPMQSQITMESGQKYKFGLVGIYKYLDKGDYNDENYQRSWITKGFKDKTRIKENLMLVLRHMKKTYAANELPEIDPVDPIQLLEFGESFRNTPSSFKFTYDFAFAADVELKQFQPIIHAIDITFQSRDGNSKQFDFRADLDVEGRYFPSGFSVALETNCPMTLDVMLMGNRTEIRPVFGTPPFKVEWQNGDSRLVVEDLPMGEYTVEVTDAKGCTRSIEFVQPDFGEVTDVDGNVYRTVKIAGIWWMAENLRTTRKRDGTKILNLYTDNIPTEQHPIYSWYDNEVENDKTKGKLYNYGAACCDICPEGWKLPLKEDLDELVKVFGPHPVSHLRAIEGWPADSHRSTNQSGLNITPTGFVPGGYFIGGTTDAVFWIEGMVEDYRRLVYLYGHSDVLWYDFTKSDGAMYAVRCIKQ